MKVGARYAATFARLADRGEGAFVPFVVIGDPDPPRSLEIVRTLARSGADALELGLPFSDPVADGPAIQDADRRALDAGTKADDGWRIIAKVRKEFPEIPIGLLVYANLVLHAGAESFYVRASGAGVDSVLVADAPSIQSAPLEQAALARGIAPVLIAPPDVKDERLREIASRSRGYLYATTRPGVTGIEDAHDLRSDAASLLGRLRGLDPPSAPALLGFGIGSPDHVRRALELGASGAICGSAIADRIARRREGRHGFAALLEELAAFVRSMKRATLG